MRTLMPREVDAIARAPDPRQERLDEFLRRPDERVHGAVVVPVDVDVEEPRRPRHRRAQRPEHRLVAPLRDVRDRLERERHPAQDTRANSPERVEGRD
jgi:hypothetical protein